MRKKTTWIVLGSTLLLLGLTVFSRPTTDAPTPESANSSDTGADLSSPAVNPGTAPAGETSEQASLPANLPTMPNPITAAIAKGPARFQMRDRNASTFFTPRGITTALSNPEASTEERDRAESGDDAEGSSDELDSWAIHWELVGANEVEPEAKGELPGKVNYYTGDMAVTGLSTYSYIEYENVYEGVDLLVESRNQGMKYTLEVAPEVDPNVIRMRYRGAESLRMTPDGTGLRIETGVGTVEENELHVYQETASGNRVSIPAQYSNISQANDHLTWEYSIQVGGYDPSLPLVIDPTISWGTYLGGSAGITADDYGYGIAVSGNNVFVVGRTTSSDFPQVTGSYGGGTYDGFVAKIDASTTAPSVSWATYIGSSATDYAEDVVVDASGDVLVVGYTGSSSLLTTPTLSWQGGTYDAYVVKLSGSTGSTSWSTYIGGTSTDYGNSIAVDTGGNIFIGGRTYSTNLAGISAGANNGSGDAFLAKLDATQQGAVLWATYLGGSGTEYTGGIAVTSDGSGIGVSGYTASSTDFPVTTGASQSVFGGGSYDHFVALFKNTTTATDVYNLTWATYLGGVYSYEYGRGCAIDGNANLVILGRAQDDGLSTTGAFQATVAGSNDLLVAQYSPTGNLNWATYLGGTSSDYGYDIVTDSGNNVIVTGYTYSSSNFPTGTSTGFQPTANTTTESFVAKFNSTGTTLLWSSYFGGDSYDYGYGVTTDASDNIYLTGRTRSTDLVTGATLGGSSDAYVAKVDAAGTALQWSIYLGGTESFITVESGNSIATDSSGNIYLGGHTSATDFVPTASAGAYSTYGGDKADGFVARITGTLQLDWVTYLGGSMSDYVHAIAVDAASSPAIYAAGYTGTSHTAANPFPIVIAAGTTPSTWQEKFSGGSYDGFVTKFKSDGSISWSYYVGGSGTDYVRALALDSSGNPYVAGYTYSSTIAGSSQPLAGSADFFVTKLGATSATPGWTAVHGGDQADYLYDVAVGGNDLYVTGYTASQAAFVSGTTAIYGGGTYDAFVGKIDSNGNIAWATYLGGSGTEYGRGIAADSSGNTYVVGNTGSQNITSTLPYAGGTYDAYLAQYTSTGTQTSFTYIGGTSTDYGEKIELSGVSAYLVGSSSSSNLPGISTSTNSGSYDAFLSKITTGASPTVDWTIYVGGSGTDYGYAVALDGTSTFFVTGKTASTDFPVTGGFNTTLAGSEDTYVAKVTTGPVTLQATIDLSSTSLVFTSSSTQQVTLKNIGSATLNWTSSSNAAWLSVNPSSGTLAVADATQLTFTVNATGLATGSTYNGAISITDPAASNSPQSVAVTLDLTGSTPTIGLSVSTLNFTAEESTVNPPDQSVAITNTGAGTLNWIATKSSSWLTLAPTSGSVTTGADTLSVSVDITGLTTGIYSDTITVTDSSATNNPQTVSVLLDITAPSGGGTTVPAPSSSDDGERKNPLTCGGSIAADDRGGFLPLALAFFGLLLVVAIRRKV